MKQFGKYSWTPNTMEEYAQSEAKKRLKSLAEHAPEGYWMRSLKQIGTTILEGEPFGLPKYIDPFYFTKQAVAKVYDSLVYDDGEKSNKHY